MMPKTIAINKIPYCLLTHVGKSEEKNIIVQNEGYGGERLIGGWVGKGSQHSTYPHPIPRSSYLGNAFSSFRFQLKHHFLPEG